MTSDRTHSDAGADLEADMIADLLRAAGRREKPPPEAYRLALESATVAWRAKVRRGRMRRAATWALAASVLAACGLALLVPALRADRTLVVAQVARTLGTVELRGRESSVWSRVQSSDERLRSGTLLRTSANAGAGLALTGGVSVRLASNTYVELESPARIRLHDGRLYVDSGAGQAESRRLEVVTRAGTARNVGTQFEVLYVGDSYRLRVREGRVHVARVGPDLEGVAGEELAIDASGALRRSSISRDAPEWRWIEELAPTPQLDGQPVAALLAWVERETGRRVRFESSESEQQAHTTILHGELDGLAPLEALEVMLATTDLSYAILESGTILVGVRSGF